MTSFLEVAESLNVSLVCKNILNFKAFEIFFQLVKLLSKFLGFLIGLHLILLHFLNTWTDDLFEFSFDLSFNLSLLNLSFLAKGLHLGFDLSHDKL